MFGGITTDISLECNEFLKRNLQPLKPNKSKTQDLLVNLFLFLFSPAWHLIGHISKRTRVFLWLLSSLIMSNWSTKPINSLPSMCLNAFLSFFFFFNCYHILVVLVIISLLDYWQQSSKWSLASSFLLYHLHLPRYQQNSLPKIYWCLKTLWSKADSQI